MSDWIMLNEHGQTTLRYACRLCRHGLMYMTSPHLCEAMVVASDADLRLAERVDWCRRTLRQALKKVFDRYDVQDAMLGV